MLFQSEARPFVQTEPVSGRLSSGVGPRTMFQEMLEWWRYDFWLGLAGFAVGLAAISPFLLSKRFRRWLCRSSLEPEGLGLCLIVLAIIAIGLYNRLSAGGT